MVGLGDGRIRRRPARFKRFLGLSSTFVVQICRTLPGGGFYLQKRFASQGFRLSRNKRSTAAREGDLDQNCDYQSWTLNLVTWPCALSPQPSTSPSPVRTTKCCEPHATCFSRSPLKAKNFERISKKYASYNQIVNSFAEPCAPICFRL